MVQPVYRLYAKTKKTKRFKPVDWSTGKMVTNLLYASVFKEDQLEILKEEIGLPENVKIFDFEIRKI